MGHRALSYFDQAEAVGGLAGKIRLATLVKMTSTEAASLADTDELCSRMEKALAQLTQDLKTSGAKMERLRDLSARGGVGEHGLRAHADVLLDLLSQRSLFLGDVDATIRRIDEAAARTLACARVSVWFLDEQRTKIRCADLFESDSGKHSSGTELFQKDFADYFKALVTERTIAAHDAHKDPRTAGFSAPYLTPLGINSMLDVPIWAQGEMVGVLCHEHIGPARTWNSDEERFAYFLATFVALALERR